MLLSLGGFGLALRALEARFGRLSLVNDFGRSILVTGSPFEAEVWLRHYAGSDFENIRPTLGDAPLADHVLDVLASGLARTRDEVADLLLSSFTGQVQWAQALSRAEFTAALAAAIELCVGEGLEVRHWCRELGSRGLPTLWVPSERDFIGIPELPLLGSGKVNLKAVKEMALALARRGVA